jgi:hypothetical protein
MKRIVVLAVVLFSAGVSADDPSPFLTGDALTAEVARNCAEGCVVMSPQEVALLTQSVNAMLAQREQRAFASGFGQGSKSCRNAI